MRKLNPAAVPFSAHALARVVAIVLLAALAIAPAAVNGQSDSSIAGAYTVTISREDVPTDLADGYSFVGRWIISFNADGSYQAERQDVGVVVTGSYEVDGNEVTITDEAGLVACSNPTSTTIEGDDDIASGTYEWAMSGSTLTLIPMDDGCRGRTVLLTSRTLSVFVPCDTVPVENDGGVSGPGTPIPVAPDEETSDPLAILTPDEPAATAEGDALQADTTAIGKEIDALLAQMTACWATGDADQWLPLLTTEFRATLADSPEAKATIEAAMTTPIIWERAGDIEVETETRVSAIVRSTVAQEQDFQRFVFVLEDGEWRWAE